MSGRGLTVNSGPGFYNKNYAPIRGCEHGSCTSSSDEYHGRRHGYGHRRLDDRAYDISDMYHH